MLGWIDGTIAPVFSSIQPRAFAARVSGLRLSGLPAMAGCSPGCVCGIWPGDTAALPIGKRRRVHPPLLLQLLGQKLVDQGRVGLALVGFMTWPTKKPSSFVVAARVFARPGPGWRRARHRSRLDRAGVGDLAQALSLDDRAPALRRSRPSRRTHPWRCGRRSCRRRSGRSGRRAVPARPATARCRARPVERAEQIAHRPSWPPASGRGPVATVSKYSAVARSATSTPASSGRSPYSATKRALLASGSSGIRRAAARPSPASSSSGSRSGSGK